jgi:non-reducing end alpha-L-arabinofuranosidase
MNLKTLMAAFGLCSVLTSTSCLSSSSSSSSRDSGTGGSTITGGSSSTSSGVGGSSTAGGSSSTRTSSSGGGSSGGASSSSKATGGSDGGPVTSIDGTKTVGSLTSSEGDQLCKDSYAAFGKAINQATLCKWTGLAYTISSSPINDTMMQDNCKEAEATCLKAGAFVPSCNPLPSSCKGTVAQYSTCIADRAASYSSTVATLPSCAKVTSTDRAAIWEFMEGMPDSCTSLTDKCPTLDIPTPQPGTGAGGAAGSSGSGGSGGSSGTSTGTGGKGGTGGGASGGTTSTGGSATASKGGTGGASTANATGGTGGSTSTNTSPGDLPGDVAKAAGTPFVAAHSMTRALFSAYKGPLFKAIRTSDNKEQDIGVTAAGLVDAAALKTFCTGACKLATLYDQSGNGNDMWRGDVDTNRPSDTAALAKICEMLDIEYWQMADGTKIPIALEHGWENAGDMWKDKGQCLRNRNKTKNMPVGASAQTTYGIFHGKYVNGGCCFNYGNTGKTIHYTGPGTLSALTFSKMTFWSKGQQSGPWPMVDWETGVYTGNTGKCGSGIPSTVECTSTGENPVAPVLHDIVTVVFKHDGSKHWGMKTANAKTGALSVSMDLPSLPKGYSPLKLEGGLGLGEGGAGDSGGSGGFSEGAVIAGETSEETDNALQKSIVSVYGK